MVYDEKTLNEIESMSPLYISDDDKYWNFDNPLDGKTEDEIELFNLILSEILAGQQ